MNMEGMRQHHEDTVIAFNEDHAPDMARDCQKCIKTYCVLGEWSCVHEHDITKGCSGLHFDDGQK